MARFPESLAILLDERDKALRDCRLRARSISCRLNQPSRNESGMVLTVADFKRSCARELPEWTGPPIVALDLGQSRA